ncbi:hypothetical protein Rrhod_0806 [Rhodococcus rhodnii LMG 5362]|uniref:Uncharacterized protein n=2 Tax=Rhodococcus rhodnii TaxID=38312 RepID=R7WRC0_9NOCA|nr:hypothetical protein Rrhod_0806 [Rhodococcus rhodnii LMG 5362]
MHDLFENGIPARTAVSGQRVRFDRERWLAALPDRRMWPEELDALVTDGRWGVVDRTSVFEIGARTAAECDADPFAGVRLYVAAAVWATGPSARDVTRRIHALRAPDVTARLTASLEILRERGPVDAYTASMRGGVAAVPYLGAPLFTKVLYFADFAPGSGGALILDRHVVAGLRDVGAVEWAVDKPWTSEDYRTYLALAGVTARAHATEPDVVEYVASLRGRQVFRALNAAAREAPSSDTVES